MRSIKTVTLLLLLTLLYSCSSGSAIVTGRTRQAINKDMVKIYLDPPWEYETIGQVEASSTVEFSAQAAQDRVIEELKSQAAKLGANGVILIIADSKPSENSEKKTVQGRAIYVLKE